MKIATPLMIAVMSCGLLGAAKAEEITLSCVVSQQDGPRQDLFVKVSDGRVSYGSSMSALVAAEFHEQGLAFGERRSNFVQADLAVEPCAMGLEHRPRLGRHKHQIYQYAKQESVPYEERLLRGRLAKRSKWTFFEKLF